MAGVGSWTEEGRLETESPRGGVSDAVAIICSASFGDFFVANLILPSFFMALKLGAAEVGHQRCRESSLLLPLKILCHWKIQKGCAFGVGLVAWGAGGWQLGDFLWAGRRLPNCFLIFLSQNPQDRPLIQSFPGVQASP